MTQQQPYTGGGGGSLRPGQMTAVMRAMPQVTGPKVLRIGLVQGGKVIEERVVKQRTSVTVGTSEKCMFVVVAPGVPGTFKLFELIGNDYHLNFLDEMGGRVALQTGITDLSSLRGQAKRTPQGAYQVRLTEDARGKVVVGETTFLFQFVAPPPVQPKPQLPVSVKGGLSSQIDWNLTIIAAFSFLFHFGMVGAVYSDWMDPVIDEESNIAGLIDSVRALPPPPVETPTEPTEKTGETASTSEAPKAGPPSSKGGGAQKGGSMSSGERARLSAQLDQLEMATIGALGAQGPAVAGVLRGGDVPTGALDAAAQSGAGVSATGGAGLGLNLGGGGGGILKPGMSGGGLGNIGSTTTSGGGVGQAVAVKGPQGNANVGAATVAGGNVGNAERVVAGMRAGFRACYNRGLATNPDLAGSVRVIAKVGPNGEVLSATPQASGLTPDVVDCVVRRVKSGQFAPPEGGSSTITIPVTFVKQ